MGPVGTRRRNSGTGGAAAPWIGRDRPRVEDARLITGRGRYVDDVPAERCLHVAFARSPEAHARIDAIDIDAALHMDGVVAVYTGADVAALGALPVNPLIPNVEPPRWPVLAADTVYAVGEPVAAVVAETRVAAQDGAEAVAVDYTPLAPVLDAADPAGTLLFAGRDTNRAFTQAWQAGDADAAFGRAATRVAVSVGHARIAPASLEPRAALAVWSATNGLTVWLSTQTPHRARTDLAAILGEDPARLRVIAPDVGGAFGMKASLYPEDALVAWAARELERPVRWTATRGDDLTAATHGRGGRTRAEAALDADGRLLAIRAEVDMPLGHWLPYSAVVPARNAARILPGPYAVDTVDIVARGHLTTTAPVGIYRGAGRPEAATLMERLMDEAAHVTGLDPVEIRRRNLRADDGFPHRTATGEQLDSGAYHALLDRACTAAGLGDLLRLRDERRAAGALCGVGIGFYVEPCGAGWESARVALDADGRSAAATGSSAQGQGRETSFAQIVADALGVDPDAVTVVHGDTARAPEGIGALASRSTAIGGTAMLLAAREVRTKAVALGARLLQADPESVETTAEGLRAGSDGPALSWRALADAARAEGIALDADTVFRSDGETWAAGCCIAALSIDPETGVPTLERLTLVDDAGVIVNPMLADGQLVGGIAQGLGEALMERVVYDGDGQLVTGSFMDYAMPRASDMPEIGLDRLETPATANRLGAKGVGEAGCIGVPVAVLNAALDALRPAGVTDLTMPLTGETLWRALREAQTRDEDR